MKILTWNIRGLANPTSQNELANLCILHRPLLVAITEPMVDFEKIGPVYWQALHLSLVAVSANDSLRFNFLFLFMCALCSC